MKLKLFFVVPMAIAAVVVLGVACRKTAAPAVVAEASQKTLYYTCPMHPSVKSDHPGNCPLCGMSLQPVYESGPAANETLPAKTNDPAAGSQAVPYPLDICVVDGMKLGSMGDPYVFVYQGQEIKLCCAGCRPEFLKDPERYLQKIRNAKLSPAKLSTPSK